MKSLLFLWVSTLMIIQLHAQDYAVVTNKNFNSLNVGQIKALFLKKTSYLGDKLIVPLNLSSRNTVRLSFEKKVLHMSFSRLKSYWTKQHYLGHRPPISMKSEESIVAFIKKVDGAIGYMKLEKVDSSLKIVYEWSD